MEESREWARECAHTHTQTQTQTHTHGIGGHVKSGLVSPQAGLIRVDTQQGDWRKIAKVSINPNVLTVLANPYYSQVNK